MFRAFEELGKTNQMTFFSHFYNKRFSCNVRSKYEKPAWATLKYHMARQASFWRWYMISIVVFGPFGSIHPYYVLYQLAPRRPFSAFRGSKWAENCISYVFLSAKKESMIRIRLSHTDHAWHTFNVRFLRFSTFFGLWTPITSEIWQIWKI
jgi:hypothetical protein